LKRWPLKRYILVVTIIFALVMCLLISTVNYFTARRARYQSFEFYIRDVLNYTASAIDTDDLAECIRTGVESEKYRELQRFMDQIKEHINLHFLYVICIENGYFTAAFGSGFIGESGQIINDAVVLLKHTVNGYMVICCNSCSTFVVELKPALSIPTNALKKGADRILGKTDPRIVLTDEGLMVLC